MNNTSDAGALREALEPFAKVAEFDIGSDETDDDLFAPMRSGYNRAPLITVGDMRRARAALASPAPATGETEARFFIDHGMIHDRVTGKHVTTDGQPPFEDSLEQVLALLNSLASPPAPDRAGVREALDNSQSLLVMLLSLGEGYKAITFGVVPAGITEKEWKAEDLTELLTDQIVENRAALAPGSGEGSGTESEAARLRKGIQDYLDGNYANPRAGRTISPQTQCPHGKFYWEACENCTDEHFTKLLAPSSVTQPDTRSGGE